MRVPQATGDREREQWEEVKGQVSRGRANGLANTLFCLVPSKRLGIDGDREREFYRRRGQGRYRIEKVQGFKNVQTRLTALVQIRVLGNRERNVNQGAFESGLIWLYRTGKSLQTTSQIVGKNQQIV